MMNLLKSLEMFNLAEKIAYLQGWIDALNSPATDADPFFYTRDFLLDCENKIAELKNLKDYIN